MLSVVLLLKAADSAHCFVFVSAAPTRSALVIPTSASTTVLFCLFCLYRPYPSSPFHVHDCMYVTTRSEYRNDH